MFCLSFSPAAGAIMSSNSMDSKTQAGVPVRCGQRPYQGTTLIPKGHKKGGMRSCRNILAWNPPKARGRRETNFTIAQFYLVNSPISHDSWVQKYKYIYCQLAHEHKSRRVCCCCCSSCIIGKADLRRGEKEKQIFLLQPLFRRPQLRDMWKRATTWNFLRKF